MQLSLIPPISAILWAPRIRACPFFEATPYFFETSHSDFGSPKDLIEDLQKR